MAVPDDLENLSSARISRAQEQVSTELQDEIVILNVKSGKYYNLNAVGSRIWDLIEQPATTVSIVDAITNEFNVDRQRCEEDVHKVITAMRHAGLVEIEPETPTLPDESS